MRTKAKVFLEKHGQSPEQINAGEALEKLSEAVSLGLEGRAGGLPMAPSYLDTDIEPHAGTAAVLDAGGTSLRTALAIYDGNGWSLRDIETCPMTGKKGEISASELYDSMAQPLLRLESVDRVGCCFSYLVDIEKTLDGRLVSLCKELRAPEAVGEYVGASLAKALNGRCERVVVLNDAIAALLGTLAEHRLNAPCIGLVMGTGMNVCYRERCENIKKLPANSVCGKMLISSEAGEFKGFELGDFDAAVIAATDEPDAAWAEKQCAGGYLPAIIAEAWCAAAREGTISRAPERSFSAAEISSLISGEKGELFHCFAPHDAALARELAALLTARAAKIGAVLTAEFVLRSAENGRAYIAAEGSFFWKMAGFKETFSLELQKLLAPRGISSELIRSSDPCLIGAALAAFAR